MKLGLSTALATCGLLILCACGSGGAASTASPTTIRTMTAAPSVSPTASARANSMVRKRLASTIRPIPFRTRRVHDPTLAKGTRRVRTRGVAGRRRLTFELTFTDGVLTGRKLLHKQVLSAPVTRVLALGTRQARQCDPNYSGACVPIASDVDCAGGDGNGPAYVQGPVQVVGTDIYGLDADGDGIGCDS